MKVGPLPYRAGGEEALVVADAGGGLILVLRVYVPVRERLARSVIDTHHVNGVLCVVDAKDNAVRVMRGAAVRQPKLLGLGNDGKPVISTLKAMFGLKFHKHFLRRPRSAFPNGLLSLPNGGDEAGAF
jgi:hypothetical protein